MQRVDNGLTPVASWLGLAAFLGVFLFVWRYVLAGERP
jgi:hypothetical protein